MKYINRQPMTAIILAGGNSSRMRKDKSLMPVQGAPLIQQVADNLTPYFHQVVISARHPGDFGFLPYTVVHDKNPGYGPLMGILCGLEASRNSVNFVTACDIPEIDPGYLDLLAGFTRDYEIVVPVSGKEKYEPLFAFYHRDLIGRIRDMLDRERRKIIELYPMASTKYVPMEPNDWYFNLNTQGDFRLYMSNRPERIKN